MNCGLENDLSTGKAEWVLPVIIEIAKSRDRRGSKTEVGRLRYAAVSAGAGQFVHERFNGEDFIDAERVRPDRIERFFLGGIVPA